MSDTAIPTKLCRRCDPPTQKPLSAFGANKNTKSGLQSYCRECVSAISCEWAKQNRARVNEQRQKRRASGRYAAQEKTYRQRYNATHKAQANAYNKKWREKKREHYQMYWRKRYADKQPHIRALAKTRYAVNPQRFRDYDKQRRPSKKTLLLARTCPQCRHSLQKRDGETWKAFAVRTLCGSPACLKRHLQQVRLAQEWMQIRQAQEAVHAAQEHAKAERIAQARAWSDADAREQVECELRQRSAPA